MAELLGNPLTHKGLASGSFNDILTSGIYAVHQSLSPITDYPEGSKDFGTLIVFATRDGGSGKVQIYVTMSGTFYVRTKWYDSDWIAWKLLLS